MRATLIACLGFLVSGSVAGASEDAGTRSVFASGVGNRALSMGGAFVGIADDPSAMSWNAAGLGRLQRFEIQASHAAYGDLGSSEDHVSAALPSYRWGAVGLIVRRYGIDGVEARDAGNTLLADDLSDSEMELGLGFGRPLSAALNVGAVLKLQRQSLAGFSGSGLGVDIGILGRAPASLRARAAWTDRLTWGASVRNAIQPSIRLDQESVRDPSVARAGLAYEQPSIAGRPATLAVDLEKSPGMAARLHAGLEIRVHPLLGLRAGLDAGRVTAGMGVAWRDFSVDYAFANEDVTVHRVGISRALGRTVTEQREASSRARDAALQAALDDAYQRRQEQQLADLLARVRTAQSAGDHDKALELLATITTLYPNQFDTRPLEAVSLREKGRQLEAKSDYAGAVLAYRRATAIAPADTAATAGLSRSQAEIDRRASRDESLRRRLAQATATADSLRRLPVRPTTPPAVTQAPPPAPTSRPSLSPEMAREVERLYRAGLGAMTERRPDDALRYWEIAWSMAPGYKRLADYLKREYLIRGMDSFASGKLEQAIAYWDKARDVDPGDPRAADYITRARTQQTRAREIIEGSR